jgi:hypothetical protein
VSSVRTTLLVVLFLLLYPPLPAPGQQSGRSKFTIIQGGERIQVQKQQPAQPLTNDSSIKLVKAGLGGDTIIKMVNTQPGKYSLGVEDIIALKKAGVSEKIITGMLTKPASDLAPGPFDPAGCVGEAGPAFAGRRQTNGRPRDGSADGSAILSV